MRSLVKKSAKKTSCCGEAQCCAKISSTAVGCHD